jgi:hypothetical protein
MTFRLFAISSCALALAAAAVSVAAADPPGHFSDYADQTFFAPLTSAVCGFPVFVTQTGTTNVTLQYAADGTTVVQEQDWNPDFRTTFTAPTQGTSFSYQGGGQLHTEYPEGAVPGKPAIATFTGFNRRLGDDPAEAGRVVMSAVVVFVDPTTGIPGIETLDVLSASGHFLGDTLARRCAALTP